MKTASFTTTLEIRIPQNQIEYFQRAINMAHTGDELAPVVGATSAALEEAHYAMHRTSRYTALVEVDLMTGKPVSVAVVG